MTPFSGSLLRRLSVGPRIMTLSDPMAQATPGGPLQPLQVVQTLGRLRFIGGAGQFFNKPIPYDRFQLTRDLDGLTPLPFPVLGMAVRHRKGNAVVVADRGRTVPCPQAIEILDIEVVQ